MTDKRFIIDDDGIVTDMVDLSMYIDNEDCCEKLNELSDENQTFREALKELKAKVDDKEVAVEVETCKLIDNIINLIDKKITEINQEYDPYARQGKVLDMSNRQFAISILNELKKELKE